MGHNSRTKYRHVVPIFSKTLVPAFHVDVPGSAIVAACLIEALARAERVAKCDRNSRIPTLDYNVAVNAPAKLPCWYPGELKNIISPSNSTSHALSLYCKFDGSPIAKLAAAAEIRAIYGKYPAAHSDDSDVDIDLTAENPIMPLINACARVLYCNPIVLEMLCKVDNKAFSVAWREFFLHSHVISKYGGAMGPIVYKNIS